MAVELKVDLSEVVISALLQAVDDVVVDSNCRHRKISCFKQDAFVQMSSVTSNSPDFIGIVGSTRDGIRFTRCLVPQCCGGTIDATTKETLWDRYCMGAPRPLTASEQQYSDRRLRSKR